MNSSKHNIVTTRKEIMKAKIISFPCMTVQQLTDVLEEHGCEVLHMDHTHVPPRATVSPWALCPHQRRLPIPSTKPERAGPEGIQDQLIQPGMGHIQSRRHHPAMGYRDACKPSGLVGGETHLIKSSPRKRALLRYRLE